MIKIEFIFKEIKTLFECHYLDNMENICQKFASTLKISNQDLSFKYNGYELNQDLSLEENLYLNKENKLVDETINIIVYNLSNKKLENNNSEKKIINNNKLNEEYEKKVNYKFKKKSKF